MAQSFTSIIMDFIDKYKFYAWMLLLVVLLFIGFLYVYRKNFNKLLNNKEIKNIPNSGSNNDVEIIMFTVDWCPHCKNAMPEWSTFKKQYDNKDQNGYKIRCVDVDCTKETSDVTNYLNKYNIESYPTIKMVKDNKTIEFDSPIKSQYLEHFVDTMTN